MSAALSQVSVAKSQVKSVSSWSGNVGQWVVVNVVSAQWVVTIGITPVYNKPRVETRGAVALGGKNCTPQQRAPSVN